MPLGKFKKELQAKIQHVPKEQQQEILNLMLFPDISSHNKFLHLGIKLFICKHCGKSQKD